MKAEVQQIIAEIGMDMAGRARIALAAPMGETLLQAEQELATPVKAEVPGADDEDAEDNDDEDEAQ